MPEPLSRQVFQPHSVIVREGEQADCAYLIESGRVEVSALRGGRSVRLAVLGENDFFGEMALVDHTVRSATVTALDETHVVIIDADRFRAEIDRGQPLMQMFVRVLVERLRSTGGRLLSYESPGTDPEHHQDQRRRSDPASTELAVGALQLEHDLRHAISAGQLAMHYQPIVELQDGRIVGFEALMRWQRGKQGVVMPRDFIGVAETSGLIVPIGMIAIEQSCAVLNSLANSSSLAATPLFMGINVSPRQFAEPSFFERLRRALDESGVLPEQIHLEITETSLMDDPDRAVATLNRIKDFGVRLSIDDFGTGYSSLSYLSRFPIDTLKIDRSFVSTMETTPASLQIVRAIARLAQSLEMTIVAEGIEAPTQSKALSELGCQNGQGYLFSKPVPATELATLLWTGVPPRARVLG